MLRKPAAPTVPVVSSGKNRNIVSKTTLPDGPKKVTFDFNVATMFLYGEPGVGKTSFAAQFPDALFFMFEPGGRWLEIAQLPKDDKVFANWQEFVSAIDAIVASPRFKTIIIDTVDIAYEKASEKILEDSGEDHINSGTLAYGTGFDKADALFKKEILRIASTGRGIIFISHAKSQDFERATGAKYSKLVGTVKDRGRRFIDGFVDVTGYYGYFGDSEHWLQIQGTENVHAKQRIKGRFMTARTNKPLYAIPMGESPEESYKNFMLAFNNKQVDQHILRKASIETKARIVRK